MGKECKMFMDTHTATDNTGATVSGEHTVQQAPKQVQRPVMDCDEDMPRTADSSGEGKTSGVGSHAERWKSLLGVKTFTWKLNSGVGRPFTTDSESDAETECEEMESPVWRTTLEDC